MILESIILIETILSEHVNEIVSIIAICVSINFAIHGGFKIFKKPAKIVKCPHLEKED